ncbi:MAG: hypothetical protein WB607_15790 [Candidatus Acidiferrum sp.]|jgi:hypothetical protein
MEKLYRLVQADGFSFKSFGLTFGVRTNHPLAIDMIRAHLPPGSSVLKVQAVDRLYSFFLPNSARQVWARPFHLLYGNAQTLAKTHSDAELLEVFETDLNLHIATATERLFFIHAGVVAWKGKAIVIPGSSYTGKSTLVGEFLRQGATYYSDEFAVFDPRGYVHPFPKPLGIRMGADQKQTRVSPAQYGCAVGMKPIRLGLILFTRYLPSARWRPKVISPGKAALNLLQHSFSVRERPEAAFAFADKVTRRTRVLVGPRGEAKDLVRVVCQEADLEKG